MNILVIGNGFDKAHKLKTDYNDFLDYLKIFDKGKKPELASLVENCGWVDYFNKRRKKFKDWNGFESEIARACQIIELLVKENLNEIGELIPRKIRLDDNQHETILSFSSEDVSYVAYDSQDLITILDKMIDDLGSLIKALEIYLHEEVDRVKRNKLLKEIIDYRANHIISFNYTNTYERLYTNPTYSPKICYIHGKAREDVQSGDCNMVLGAEDNISEYEENEKDIFIQVKKFYQRILKKTGSEYQKWIEGPEVFEVAIYGHSLDFADHNILNELIDNKNSRVYIYYHNEASHSELIQNLVKILGRNKVINYVYGKDAKIQFIKASKEMTVIK